MQLWDVEQIFLKEAIIVSFTSETNRNLHKLVHNYSYRYKITMITCLSLRLHVNNT